MFYQEDKSHSILLLNQPKRTLLDTYEYERQKTPTYFVKNLPSSGSACPKEKIHYKRLNNVQEVL